MKRISCIGLTILCLLFSATVFAESVQDVTVTMIHPVAGQQFTAGETVEIQWSTVIPKGLDCTWCEQEIFLSLDGGQTLSHRLTRQLSPEAGRYTWTVPNTPTENAVLVMQFGMEAATSIEIRPTQNSASFKILPPVVPLESVKLLAFDTVPVAGERIKLRWESTVSSVSHYEVYISFDRGGHFQKLGDAKRKRISWKIPRDFHGSVVFRIDAIRKDGSVVESAVNAQPDLFIP